MNVLITAGGLTERIDDVRSITNTGTGRLGALCAERFVEHETIEIVHCIFSSKAVIPAPECGADKIQMHLVSDFSELENAVQDVCTQNRMDAVIHSMAVSDYRVRTVSTTEMISNSAEAAGLDVTTAILNAPNVSSGGKIGSEHENLVILMEKNPKIIALFRPMLPNAVIIGFKMLSSVSEDELIKSALALLVKNDCDYVLANDSGFFAKGRHVGHLVSPDGRYDTFSSKEAIADAIIAAIIKHKH